VDRNWPGGMSGGPVVNAGGHVVGVVSTGMTVTSSGEPQSLCGTGNTIWRLNQYSCRTPADEALVQRRKQTKRNVNERPVWGSY